MALSDVVFKPNTTKESEVMGKKIVSRSLTTRDTLDMDLDLLSFIGASAADGKDMDLKATIRGMIEFLSSAIVSINGVIPENKEETKQFLLNQEQGIVIQIFAAINEEAVATAVAEQAAQTPQV